MAPRRTTPPKPEAPVLTPDQMRRRVERLQSCIRDLEAFDPQSVHKRYGIPEVMALEASIKDALAAAFGDGTQAYNRYKRAASLDNGPHELRGDPVFGGGNWNHEGKETQEARQYLADGKRQSSYPRPRIRNCRSDARRSSCRLAIDGCVSV